MKTKLLILMCLSVLNLECVVCVMSEKQMKAALKLVRNTCQPKTKVTSEEIDAMHNGQWDDLSKEAQCYVRCGMDMHKMMTKDHKLNYDAIIATLKNMAPPSIYAIATQTFSECKDAAVTPEKCASGFEVARCIYFANPEGYFFP